MESQSDLELVQQAKQGSLSAFEVMVKRYQKRIFYLSFRMTKDLDAADDIAQETFIKAYQNISSFKESYAFYTWIYRICMNLAINYLRRQRFLVQERKVDDFQQLIDSQIPTVESDGSSEEEELLEDLRKEIELLPVDYRAVTVLKIYENLSCGEIAKILKIPMGTVLSRLARAREQLARRIKVKRGE
jgi:RNA polymerase sigma-70 factor (ECF subfamily)